MRHVLALSLGLSSLLTAAHGWAAPRDPAAAEVLFRDGRKSAEAKDYPAACPKFAESLRLDPAPGTLLNLADCEEHTGQLATAWQHYKQLAEQLASTDERYALAHERFAAIEKRLPRLTISLPAGASPESRVFRDDVELGSASLGVPLPVNPGAHAVVVTAPGRMSTRNTVIVGEGQTQQVTPQPGMIDADARGSSTKRTAGWVVGGVGLAALATGGVFGIRALTKRAESDARCTNGVCQDAAAARAYDDAKTSSRIADVGLGLGVVAIGVSAYLLLTSNSAEPSAPPRTVVQLTPSGLGGVW